MDFIIKTEESSEALDKRASLFLQGSKEEIQMALKASELCMIIESFFESLRQEYKYKDLSEEMMLKLNEIREKLYNLVHEYKCGDLFD